MSSPSNDSPIPPESEPFELSASDERIVEHTDASAGIGGFKYYIFDWDDNVLHMPTKIVLEKREDDGQWSRYPVSTSMFALIRNDTENFRPPGGDWESAFVNFRDLQERGESAFLADTRKALQPIIDGEAKGAPCFDVFRKTLIDGRLFGIVTARGHKPESIRKGVEYFIDQVLTDEERATMIGNLRRYRVAFGEDEELPDTDVLDAFLSLNKYHGVTSPEFQRGILGNEEGSSHNPEEAKQVAIRDFVEHVLGIIGQGNIDAPISVGFSDDDLGNITAVKEYIEQFLAKEYPHVSFVVFDTSDPDLNEGKKIILQGQLELGLDEPS